MIFICTALYIEAEPIIKTLDLVKDTLFNKFQIFKNDYITLIVTGKGKVKSAISLSIILANFSCSDSDFVINIGLCGTTNKNYSIGDTFICNKIIDNDTKKTYFTDIIFNHPFKETSLECCSNEINNSNSQNFEGALIDMESSGIYQSALTFYQNHQIYFIKTISDYIENTIIDKKSLIKICDKSTPKIVQFINYLKNNIHKEEPILNDNEILIINKCSDNLKLSCTLHHEFIQIIKYYKLLYGEFSNISNYALSVHPKSKKEGKIYLDKIRDRYI